MTSTNEWTRVVVLTPPPQAGEAGRGLADGLKASFVARDWFALEQHDPYLAMAELCLRERAQVARSAWGLQRMELLALLILEPQRQPQLNELIAAIQQYVPSATIWTAIETEIVPLDGAAGQPAQPRVFPPIATVEPKHSLRSSAAQSPPAPSALRLVNDPVIADRAQARTTAQTDNEAVEITEESSIESQPISREEIEMLLATELPAATTRPHRSAGPGGSP